MKTGSILQPLVRVGNEKESPPRRDGLVQGRNPLKSSSPPPPAKRSSVANPAGSSSAPPHQKTKCACVSDGVSDGVSFLIPFGDSEIAAIRIRRTWSPATFLLWSSEVQDGDWGVCGSKPCTFFGSLLAELFFQVFSFVMLVYGEQGKAEGDGTVRYGTCTSTYKKTPIPP